MSKFDEFNTAMEENSEDLEGKVGAALVFAIGAAGGAVVVGAKEGISKGWNWLKTRKENADIAKEIRKEENEAMKAKIQARKEAKEEEESEK